jgi:hypothetical protein
MARLFDSEPIAMADIPKSIRIGGRQVKITIVEDLEEYGNFHEDTLTIQLKKADAETMRVTLRHELMHAALSISGIAYIDRLPEEAIVRCFDNIFFPAWESTHKRSWPTKSS